MYSRCHAVGTVMGPSASKVQVYWPAYTGICRAAGDGTRPAGLAVVCGSHAGTVDIQSAGKVVFDECHGHGQRLALGDYCALIIGTHATVTCPVKLREGAKQVVCRTVCRL